MIIFFFTSGLEVRQFLFSNIISFGIDDGKRVAILYRGKKNLLIEKEIKEFDERIIILSAELNLKNRRLQNYVSLCLDILDERYESRWRYSNKIESSGLRILKYALSYTPAVIIKLLEQAEEILLKRSLNINVLSPFRIERVITTNSRYSVAPDLYSYCSFWDIPVYLAYHSYKELFAAPRIRIKFKKIGFWSENMQKSFTELNGNTKNKDFQIIGTTQFAYLTDEGKDGEYFGDDYVLYFSAGKNITGEAECVRFIAGVCEGIGLKLIVRLNPMDLNSRLKVELEDVNNIMINQPDWVHDLGGNRMNYPIYKDIGITRRIMQNALLYISIPSTVSIEAAICKKPVINIVHNMFNIRSESGYAIADYWTSPFYDHFRTKSFINKWEKPNDLKELILTSLEEKDSYDYSIEEYFYSPKHSFDNMLSFCYD